MPNWSVLVAKGYTQKHGVDYIACLETIRMVISLAAQKGWKIKSAFLCGVLSEEVFIEKRLVINKKSYLAKEGFRKCPYVKSYRDSLC
ncbi:hypothetical protein CR513_56598, partial [Mucuna pruriens]